MSDTIIMLFMVGATAEMMGMRWLTRMMVVRGVASLFAGVSVHYLIFDKVGIMLSTFFGA